MRKKLLLGLAISATLSMSIFAKDKKLDTNSTDANIIKLLKEKGGVQDAKVIKTSTIYQGLRVSILEDSHGMQFPIISSSDGNLVMPFSKDIISTNLQVASIASRIAEQVTTHNKIFADKKVIDMLKTLPSNAFLKLASGKDKTVIIVSDPECPYCRKELENIDARLKDSNVYMIFAPVHGKSAFIKSDLIYEKAAKASSNSEKIEIIKHYYDVNVKLTDDELKVNPEITQNNAKVIFGSKLIQGVPFVLETEKDTFK